MKTAALVREAKKRYPFLKDTFIEFDGETPAYGLSNTAYKPGFLDDHDSITINLAHLRDKFTHERRRFERRLGKLRTFEQFVLLTFLHEINHAYQFRTGDPLQLSIAYQAVVDEETHDAHPQEIEADKWARQEFKKWKK